MCVWQICGTEQNRIKTGNLLMAQWSKFRASCIRYLLRNAKKCYNQIVMANQDVKLVFFVSRETVIVHKSVKVRPVHCFHTAIMMKVRESMRRICSSFRLVFYHALVQNWRRIRSIHAQWSQTEWQWQRKFKAFFTLQCGFNLHCFLLNAHINTRNAKNEHTRNQLCEMVVLFFGHDLHAQIIRA